MSDGGQDLEMNTIAPQEQTDLEQDAPVLPVLGRTQPPRRQAWEFKCRHVEGMLLGYSLLFDDLFQGARLVLEYFCDPLRRYFSEDLLL